MIHEKVIKSITCGAALLASAGSVQATVISQTKTFDGTPNYTSILNFNQFDDNGGAYTLNSIQVSVQLNTDAGASLRIDNDGAAIASGTTEFGSDGIILSSDVNLTKTDLTTFNGAIQSTTSKFMLLAADDGDADTFSELGADFDVLTSVASSQNDSAFISSLFFSQYIGTDSYDITYKVNQFMDLSSFGGSQVQFDPLGADGSITVTHDYAIPEPASLAMICICSGAALFIRRTFLV